MKFQGIAIGAAAFMSFAAAAPASAAPIVYNISGGMFADGTAFTGGFTYETSNNSISAFDVNTNAGVLPAFHYVDANSGAYVGGGAGPNNFITIADTGTRYFNFSFASSLATGASQSISTSSSYECNNCGTFRRVTAGTVSTGAVPEPATWAMMILGMGAVGFAMRRKSNVTTRVAFARA
jgi:hypothetical protein